MAPQAAKILLEGLKTQFYLWFLTPLVGVQKAKKTQNRVKPPKNRMNQYEPLGPQVPPGNPPFQKIPVLT